jgi:hypothetical protein
VLIPFQKSRASSTISQTRFSSGFKTDSSTKKVSAVAFPVHLTDILSEIFVDVEGDKYLARIVKTFPPKNLPQPPSSPPPFLGDEQPLPIVLHPLGMDLEVPLEEINDKDNPMGYFYNVRLIEEGVEERQANYNGSVNGAASNGSEPNAKWEGSVMEVKADKLRLVSCVRYCQVLTGAAAIGSTTPAQCSNDSFGIASFETPPSTLPGWSSRQSHSVMGFPWRCQTIFATA